MERGVKGSCSPAMEGGAKEEERERERVGAKGKNKI
jgi:hypothetical protein